MISAPLGAFLLSLLPIQGILIIDVATALLAILPLLLTRIPQPARNERGQVQREGQTTVWQDFQAGLRYFWVGRDY